MFFLAEKFTAGVTKLLSCGHRVYAAVYPTGYQCFELNQGSRERILERFPPKFSQVEAHHITYEYGVSYCVDLPPTPKIIEVVGYACDQSLECLVVSIDGEITRTDGLIYHITLSHQPERSARESNDLLQSNTWQNCGGIFLSGEPQFRVIKKNN